MKNGWCTCRDVEQLLGRDSQRLLSRPLALISFTAPSAWAARVGPVALDLPPLAFGAAEGLTSPLLFGLAAVPGMTYVRTADRVHPMMLFVLTIVIIIVLVMSELLLVIRMRLVHG